MKYQSTKRIRTGLLTAALAGGTLLGASQLGGIANAQTDETPTTETPVDDTTVPAETPSDDAETDEDQRSGDGKGQEIADVLGIEVAELREQLAAGSTLAEIAEANGVEVQTVIDALVVQMSERLDRAVEDGRMDAAEAEEKLAEFEERATTAVNEGGRILQGRGGGRGGEHRSEDCADGAAGEDEAAAGDAATDDTSDELVLVES